MAAVARISYLARALHPRTEGAPRPLPVRVGPGPIPSGWPHPDGTLRAGKDS